MQTPRQEDQRRWYQRRDELKAFLRKHLATDLSLAARDEIYELVLISAKKLGFYGRHADADEVMESAWAKCEFGIKQVVVADRRARLSAQVADGLAGRGHRSDL
jgi:hypothetical protein